MRDEREVEAFPFRPWPALGAAVVLGTALGPWLGPAFGLLPGDPGAPAEAVARLGAVALAAGAALALAARRTGGPRAWSAWLVLIAFAAALRALPAGGERPSSPGDGPGLARPSGRFTPLGTSIAGARDDERPARRWIEPEGERRVHGRLEPRAEPDVRWTTTEGTLAAGERVVLLVDPRALRVADADAGTGDEPGDDDMPPDAGDAGHDAAGLGATPFSGPARGPVSSPRAPPARVALAPDEVVRVARAVDGPLDPLARRLERVRAAGLERVRALRRPATRGLAAALLYGDRSELDPATSDLFVRTGTQHLLAVSGLHVALVAWLALGPLAALLRRVVAGRAFARGHDTGRAFARGHDTGRAFARGHGTGRARLAPGLLIGLVQALVVGAYVPLAGARPPVVRAALCCALAALALGVRRPRAAGAGGAARRATLRPDALSLWSLALVLECLGDPRAPHELSVQLSYGATLGLVVGYAPLRRALGGLTRRARVGELDRRGRPRAAWWRVPLARLVDVGIAGVAVSCVAMLATLPFAWAAFGEVSPWSIVLTPLVVPLVAAFLAVGFALAPWPALAAPPLDALAHAIVTLLDAADRLPATPLALPGRPTALVATATALTFAALVWKRARTVEDGADDRRDDAERDPRREGATLDPRRGHVTLDPRRGDATLEAATLAPRPRDVARALVPRLAALAWAVVLVPWAAAPRGLELWALDVGGGTAVVLRAPGAGTWVFDAGSRDRAGVARGALAPLLAAWEPSAVAVVLSHEHADHHGALGWLLERYPVRLWAGALPAHLDERLPHAVPRLDLGRGALELALEPPGRPGAHGERGRRLELALLRGALGSGNEGSRALALGYLGRRVLLTGDHEAEGLAALLEDGRPDGPLELLLLPHHGSETDLFGPLLAAARPREAWISAGHAPPVGRELDRRGLAWRWTARDGPLGLAIEPAAGAGRGAAARRLGGALGGTQPASGTSAGLPPGTDRARRRGSNPTDLPPDPIPGPPADEGRPLSPPRHGEPR